MGYQIAIALGGGRELQISDEGDLMVVQNVRRDQVIQINLGQATMKRFADLDEFVKRLSIHAIDKRD
jgi:hypothetical protein